MAAYEEAARLGSWFSPEAFMLAAKELLTRERQLQFMQQIFTIQNLVLQQLRKPVKSILLSKDSVRKQDIEVHS